MNAQEEIDKVYAAYKCCPIEQIKHIPFAQFISTRFITVDEHNRIVEKLVRDAWENSTTPDE